MSSPRAHSLPTVTPKKRCAVYTRKSIDEGLDQEYNSLEAQRDAGLAFIASQRHESLGYDVVERKLIVNEREAALARDIFRRYGEHGSAARLVRELDIEGHTTKA